MGDAGPPCYKKQAMQAVEKRRERRKQATLVMEFIPGAQSIPQVLNRGPAMEGCILSPANTLGLPH